MSTKCCINQCPSPSPPLFDADRDVERRIERIVASERLGRPSPSPIEERRSSRDASGNLAIQEGNAFRLVSTFSDTPEFARMMRDRLLAPSRGTLVGRTALEGRIVHINDLASDPEYTVSEAITVGKVRTALGVPLLREGIVVGTLTLGRQHIEAFNDRQIGVVQTFADQAAIAIENVRLLNETREALEQQTATAGVLGVINSSPGELAPVFDAILEKAHSLCGIALGELELYEDGKVRAVAIRGVSGCASGCRVG